MAFFEELFSITHYDMISCIMALMMDGWEDSFIDRLMEEMMWLID